MLLKAEGKNITKTSRVMIWGQGVYTGAGHILKRLQWSHMGKGMITPLFCRRKTFPKTLTSRQDPG